MADEANDVKVASPPEADVVTPRPVYERPVLRHLGSVNRVTLSQSHQRFGDGVKTKATRG
ncbi:MAG: hypothetical protein M3O50_04410 [Myxococcota bacterium]|nr:hypothetical protein [Myxococcota bacterium]